MPRGFRVAVMAGVGAVACLVAGSAFGAPHGRLLHERLIAYGATGGFVVLGALAVQRTGTGVYRMFTFHAGRPGGGTARVLVSLVGYLLVFLTALGMLRVQLGHLLLGGAITGVIVGIAAQQALGNVFAGIVLLLAHPFRVGMRVRVRAGALGGEFFGTVRDINLTYVVLDTDQGRLNVPNSGMLAAAVGPALPAEGDGAPEPLTLRPSEKGLLPRPVRERKRRREPVS